MAGNPAGPDTWPCIAPYTKGAVDEDDNDDTVPYGHLAAILHL
jgi:hypothetical protein